MPSKGYRKPTNKKSARKAGQELDIPGVKKKRVWRFEAENPRGVIQPKQNIPDIKPGQFCHCGWCDGYAYCEDAGLPNVINEPYCGKCGKTGKLKLWI